MAEFDPFGRLVLRHYTSAIISALPARAMARDSDFDSDRQLTVTDVDRLVAAVSGGQTDPLYDLNNDELVNFDDVTAWLADAGMINHADGSTYRLGDADLDGSVDGHDFGIWNANKYTTGASWSTGDFNADGAVDIGDLGLWNANKFTRVGGSLIPEPAAGILVAWALVVGAKYRVRVRRG